MTLAEFAQALERGDPKAEENMLNAIKKANELQKQLMDK